MIACFVSVPNATQQSKTRCQTLVCVGEREHEKERESMSKGLKVLFNENANINATNVSARITSKQHLLRDEMDLHPIKNQIKQNPSTAPGSESEYARTRHRSPITLT